MRAAKPFVSWLHFGDLHITEPEQQNYRDFLALIEDANRHIAGCADFALLPGDNADQGTPAQFALVRGALDRLEMAVHILPGDHDFHSRSLRAFHDNLGAAHLPMAETIHGCRCLFLDVVSAGGGGPDFQLDQAQLNWLQDQLEAAEDHGEIAALFMHTYPADLQQGAAGLMHLLRRHPVACVDMGHTHYNELANDGRTIFMATRSTGQIEEGPVGFSLAAIDGGVVSWRFKLLEEAWPLVLITCPADHRLINDAASPDQIVRDRLRISAKVWGAGQTSRVFACIDDGPPFPLACDGRSAALWCAVSHEPLSDGHHLLTVRAEHAAGHAGSETITFLVNRDGAYAAPRRDDAGSDAESIGAWPEKHVLGTQLGPNRYGRKW